MIFKDYNFIFFHNKFDAIMDLEMLLFYFYIIGLQNYTSRYRILQLTRSTIFNKFNFQFFFICAVIKKKKKKYQILFNMCGDNKNKKVAKYYLLFAMLFWVFFMMIQRSRLLKVKAAWPSRTCVTCCSKFWNSNGVKNLKNKWFINNLRY